MSEEFINFVDLIDLVSIYLDILNERIIKLIKDIDIDVLLFKKLQLNKNTITIECEKNCLHKPELVASQDFMFLKIT